MNPAVQHATGDNAPGQIINPVPNAIMHQDKPLTAAIDAWKAEHQEKLDREARLLAQTNSEFSR